MGFLDKISKALVEEVSMETDNYPYDVESVDEDMVEVNTEEVSQDNLIGDIYSQNDLADISKSIFKVEEVINSLPKEMPNDTKKVTVLSILSSFGVTVEEVLADSENRAAILNSALKNIVANNENVIADHNANIEQKKKEIQELEKDNASRELIIKSTSDKIEDEMKRISELASFIGGGK